MNRLGFVTNSPLFENPAGFNPGATSHEEDIRMRAAAQRAMEAGRPMTMAEMYGKNLQLFRNLNGLGDETTEPLREGAKNPVGALKKAFTCRNNTLLLGVATAAVIVSNFMPKHSIYDSWQEKGAKSLKRKEFWIAVVAGAVVMAGSRKLFCKP